jgi:hypothetical protein
MLTTLRITSTKNGDDIPYEFTSLPTWVTKGSAPYEGNWIIRIDQNQTGAARNGVITATQSESGNKLNISIQQQAKAPDDQYQWVLNDSELQAEIDIGATGAFIFSKDQFVFDSLQDWSPNNPTTVTPSEPCTQEDYTIQRKLNYNSYTVRINYWNTLLSNASNKAIWHKTVTVHIWFDAKIKN